MNLKELLENTGGDIHVSLLSCKFEPIMYSTAKYMLENIIDPEEIFPTIYSVVGNVIVLVEEA